MTLKLGYLLPTREKIMLESPSVRPMIEAAKKAVDRGFDSIWAGDSLLARPRHDPITLLAGVAGAIREIELGTAVLLPALRNPVVLAQQLATLDQLTEGRLIVGAGIAPDSPAVRAELTPSCAELRGLPVAASVRQERRQVERTVALVPLAEDEVVTLQADHGARVRPVLDLRVLRRAARRARHLAPVPLRRLPIVDVGKIESLQLGELDPELLRNIRRVARADPPLVAL